MPPAHKNAADLLDRKEVERPKEGMKKEYPPKIQHHIDLLLTRHSWSKLILIWEKTHISILNILKICDDARSLISRQVIVVQES